MEPNKTCGYCGREGHYDQECPRRWQVEPMPDMIAVPEIEPRVVWHERKLGLLAADRNGKVLGQVTRLDRGETWTASAGREYLGEYVSPDHATKAVERALGF